MLKTMNELFIIVAYILLYISGSRTILTIQSLHDEDVHF